MTQYHSLKIKLPISQPKLNGVYSSHDLSKMRRVMHK